MKIFFKLLNSLWLWISVIQFIIIIIYYFNNVRPYLMGFPESADNYNLMFLSSDVFIYWINALETPLNLVPINLLGPVLIFKLSDLKFDLIFLLNIILFCIAIREIYHYTPIKTLKFVALILINPAIIGQFYAANKEVMIIISLLFISVYFYSGATRHIIYAIIIAFFSKPEFLVLIIMYFSSLKLPAALRKYILISIIMVVSFSYNYIPNIESYSTVLFRGQTVNSFGLTVLLHELAVEYYLYWAVIIPRLLLSIYSGGFLYAPIFISFLLFVLLKKKITLSNDLIYFLYLFYIMVSIVPFPLFRYIMPTISLLLFIAMQPKSKN